MRLRGLVATILATLCWCATAGAAAPSLHVRGNRLVGAGGATLRLLGVNRSGAEYACVQGWGIWDGPADSRSIAAIAAWRVNAVRVPLNEDCWLSVNGVKRSLGGAAYRSAVVGYVRRLHAAGIAAILDLHWSAPGRRPATGQQPMPDADHSVAFWRSVARTFRRDRAVAFDLYNEPHDVSWACWRNGCRVGGWRAVGMQRLVDVVRRERARQPILVGGLAYANDLAGWWAHRPRDPQHALVAAFHVYNFNDCVDERCWNARVGPLAARVPVVTGELGENDCAHGFVDRYMRWADAQGVSYLGWTWDTWDCSDGPALISGYDGTPTAFGRGLRDHLAALARAR
jgi:endoglucanase